MILALAISGTFVIVWLPMKRAHSVHFCKLWQFANCCISATSTDMSGFGYKKMGCASWTFFAVASEVGPFFISAHIHV